MRHHLLLATSVAAVCLTTAAFAEPLTIYSPQGDERGVWITEQATAAGHEIVLLNAGGGELFDRLLAEKSNPQADIVLGLVDTSMALLSAEGLFQPYTPAWADGLPAQYSDPNNLVWKFWQTPIVLAINPQKITADEAPDSWLDLIQPEYKGRYVIGALTSQTTRTYLAGILARFLDEKGDVTEEGWVFMRAFYANGLVEVDKVEAFKAGTAVIDLNWFGGAFKLATDIGYEATLIDTEGGTPVIAEGVAIMAATDQLDQSKAFIDWFGSAEVMAAYAEKFGQTPAHPAALALSPASVQQNALLVKAQPIDWAAIAPKLDGWLQKIELEIR
jgi:iron(III) transport system substrate-binding protein